MKKILALDLGTKTGWAVNTNNSGFLLSGMTSFQPNRYEGGGMRYLKFQKWLDQIITESIELVLYEEVRHHSATDAAHVYGGLMATLTSYCEDRKIPYQGVPVGTIKKFATGKGNAGKSEMIAAANRYQFTVAPNLMNDIKDDNEADAVCLLKWGIAQYGES